MTTVNITDENFDTEVLKSDKPIVVDFWAEWCGPCKQIGPTLEEISNEMVNEITIAKHNIDDEPNTVKTIPKIYPHDFAESEEEETTPKWGDITSEDTNFDAWIKQNRVKNN